MEKTWMTQTQVAVFDLQYININRLRWETWIQSFLRGSRIVNSGDRMSFSQSFLFAATAYENSREQTLIHQII